MKVYFCGSIRGGREDSVIYSQLIEHLKKYATVLTEVIGDPTLTKEDRAHGKEKILYERNIDWFKSSDAIVAEVTQTSIGVGFELGCAKLMGKKTLCLFRPDNEAERRLSAMVIGAEDEDFVVKNYTKIEEAKNFIDEFFQRLQS